MRIAIIYIAFIFYSNFCLAQVIDNDFTTSFAFKVHSIDDFFDRFNFKKNTGFQKFIKKNYPDQVLTRPQIIGSLFNNANKELMANPFLSEFIDQVTDTLAPQLLGYTDNNWFAELSCRVFYKGAPKTLIIIAKVERAINNGYRWSILSARADFLKIKPPLADSLKYLVPMIKPISLMPNGFIHFLSPISHGIDFINISNFFDDKTNTVEYLNFSQQSFQLDRLVLLIKKSEVKFVQVNSVVYHLLQLDNWILRVEESKVNDKTAGWRINKLIKTSSLQKENYMKSRLNIQNN